MEARPANKPPRLTVRRAAALRRRYNNIEGMILLSELSRRRIRSIQKLIRVDRYECVVVLRVDKEKVRLGDREPRVHGHTRARLCASAAAAAAAPTRSRGRRAASVVGDSSTIRDVNEDSLSDV